MIEIPNCAVWNAILPLHYDQGTDIDAIRGSRASCRAFRIVGDSMKFLFLKVPRRYPKPALRAALNTIVQDGVTIKFKHGHDKVGYLTFGFLGFTENSIKNRQIILLLKTVDNSDERVPSPVALLRKFGNLHSVFKKDGPGKYVARLGLSFSDTVESVNPAPYDIVQIPDRSAENGVLTTDGCGIIRETYAKEIRSKHNFDSRTTVFQIRRGGIKGLLVAYPDELFDKLCIRADSRAPSSYMLAYRPSMLKYDGGPTHIEITGVSDPPKSARLNFMFIVILVSLGVDYGGIGNLFRGLKELLKLQLRSLEMIPYDRQEALKRISGDLDAEGDSSRLIQELYEMLQAGHSMSEVYMRKKLRDYQRLQYENLREALRIEVQKSCYVYGVVDELGVLSEDEVFIHLPHREGILVSKVLIARNPAYKPSDVRLLRAVDKPELHSLTNCVVFPRSGTHSIPGSMSGGDLDGDTFFVCWESTIFPRGTVWPTQPSSQSNSSRIDWTRRNLIDALVDLFVEQSDNFLVGTASKEWQSVVEYYRRMAGARYPMELACVIEEALDLLKSGGNYEDLMRRFRAVRADYKVESLSVKRQGRRLNTLRNLVPSIKEDKEIRYLRDPDLDLQDQSPKEWAEHYNEGKRLIRQFNKGLSEAISKDDEYRKADTRDETLRRRKEDDPRYADAYTTRFIDKYFPRSPGILSGGNMISYVRASAWYCVGYDEEKPAFAWLGARFLNSIKSYETNGGRPGLSIGALRKVQAEEDKDLDRPLWYYLKHTEGPGSAFYTARIARVQLDGQFDEQRDTEFAVSVYTLW